jgi:hypothetical protein
LRFNQVIEKRVQVRQSMNIINGQARPANS